MMSTCKIKAYLCKVGSVSSNLVGDDSSLDIVPVGQAQMLLGRHIAQQRRPCAGNQMLTPDIWAVPWALCSVSHSTHVCTRCIMSTRNCPKIVLSLHKPHSSRSNLLPPDMRPPHHCSRRRSEAEGKGRL